MSFVQPDQNEIIWCINCRQFDFCTWESNFRWLTLERSPRLREHPGFLMNVVGEWRGFNRNGEMASECCLIGLGPGPDQAVSAPTDTGRRAPMPHPNSIPQREHQSHSVPMAWAPHCSDWHLNCLAINGRWWPGTLVVTNRLGFPTFRIINL